MSISNRPGLSGSLSPLFRSAVIPSDQCDFASVLNCKNVTVVECCLCTVTETTAAILALKNHDPPDSSLTLLHKRAPVTLPLPGAFPCWAVVPQFEIGAAK